MDRSRRVLRHRLYGSPPSTVRTSWRKRLSQAMIAGGPLPHLRNFHGILTNISRHPPGRENGRGVREESCRLLWEVSAFFREKLVKFDVHGWVWSTPIHAEEGGEDKF